MDLHALKNLLLVVALPLLAIAGLTACAPIQVLNTVSGAGGGYSQRDDVAYGSLPRQRLDIYTPATPGPAAGWPVVVFFYGGSWSSGERGRYRFVGSALAKQGILTLVADYRLYPEVRYPDFLEDSARALAWGLAESARLGGDPKRVFVMGHSAGGYNAAMLALDPRWLAATGHSSHELAGWIGLAGVYDFFPSDDPALQAIFHDPDYPRGGQPIEHAAAAGVPRSFIATDLHDKVVSPTRSTLALAARLREAGNEVTLRTYERPNHATLLGALAAPLRWIAPVLEDVTGFIAAAPPVAASSAAPPGFAPPRAGVQRNDTSAASNIDNVGG